MSKIASILFFMFMAVYCRAQLPLDEQRFADSLDALLHKEKGDSSRAKICFQLTFYWSSKDTAKARFYLDQGRALGNKYPFLKGVSYSQEGFLYFNSDVARSERAFLEADRLLKPLTSKEALQARSKIWQNYAVLQQRKDQDSAYIAIVLHKAIPLALQIGDSATAGAQYAGVGTAFMNTDQYDKAELYFDQARQLLKAANTPLSTLVSSYNRTAENYLYLEKYEQAKKILDTVKLILAPYPQSELYSGYYLVEGRYFHLRAEYARAVASYDKGIAAAGGLNKNYRIEELQFLKGESLIGDKDYQKARILYALLSKDENAMSTDENRRGVYEGLAAAYSGLGNKALAYDWLKRYSELSDSLNKTQLKHDINVLEIKYKNAEARKEVKVLRAEKEKAFLSARSNRLLALLLGSLSLLLLLVAVAVLLLLRSRRRLLVHNLKEAAREKELEVASALIEGGERERSRMARELHDGLGGMLAGVKIKLSGQPEKTAGLESVIVQLDQSVNELRRIARNMMPESLLKFGLETALEDLCESLRSKETGIEFQAYGMDKNIPLSVQVHIYRIIQEVLVNAVRHAQASKVVLQCSQNGKMFFITVEDNGIGFDTGKPGNSPGIGLSNIRNRVEYLKGSLEVTSAPGEGTTINMELHIEGQVS